MEFKAINEFIRKLYNEPNEFIPLHVPVFLGNEKKYLEECIDTTFVSSVGKYVDRFEEMVAEYTGAKKAIVTVNGTNALHLSLLVSGVAPEDEVITQPLTFVATANAISYCHAKPVFVDVAIDTMGMAPTALRAWLEQNTEQQTQNHTPSQASDGQKQITVNKLTGKKISAIVPMHTFGHPCRIDEIIMIGEEYNIPVVEDAAESLGSYYKGKHTGTFGKLGVLSFNGNKTLTTGGGGMILTNDIELGNHIKHISNTAKVPHKWEYIHDSVGYNYRMPNINAALGVAQMEYIDKIIENKRNTASKYRDFFDSLNMDVKFFEEPKDSFSNYWLNCVVLKDNDIRDSFLKYTNENGIMTRPIWRIMNKLKMFSDSQVGDLENSEWLENRIVNIPSSIRKK